MTRLMYDSTSPWDIPRDAQMVAGYVDGRYAWPQAWWDLFPNAVHVKISAIGVRTAPVGDVEVGCIWPPANAVPWVRRARADGYDPTIYVNELNDWLPVRQAFWAAGEPEPHYWVARYNGVREIPAGAMARQFAHPHDGDGVANYPWETGKHYDLSVVRDFWPGIDDRAPGGGGGEEDPLAGFTTRDLEDAVYRAVTNYNNDVSLGVNLAGYNALNAQMRDHVVSPLRQTIREDDDVDEQAIADAVVVRLTPDVIAAIKEIDFTGLSKEETIEALQEALRRGTGS